MTVPYNPNLLLSLPADKRYEIEANPEFVALDGEFKELTAEPLSEGQGRQRRKLYTKRHKLMNVELRKAQECKHPSTATEEIQSIDGHPAGLACFCRLMPERQRLAKSMFYG
jgi:hypothetical protein